VAVGLCRSLRDIGQDCLLYIVIEERAGDKRNENLMRSLGDVGSFGQIRKTRCRFSPRLLFDLAANFREQGVRILHCHCYKALFYAVLMRTLGFFDGAVVYTLHGLILPKGVMPSVIRGFQMLGLRTADGVIGCSREVLASSFPDPGGVKTAAIINAIELPAGDFTALQAGKTKARKELIKRYDLDPEGLVVINVGRLSSQKNFPLYLQLIQRDMSMDPDSRANYLIVGNGELQADLEAIAEKLGIRHRVVFTGFVSDMDSVYLGADLLIQTSTWEGTPMCLLEARAYGLPVIAPAVGGNIDVVTSGKDGLLYPVGDADSLMAAFAEYCRDAALRQNHGQAAYEQTGTEFGMRDWALRHMDFYSVLTEGNAPEGLA